MTLDLQKFYQACNPSKTLAVENAEDRKYYIDFSSVRGGKIIDELKVKENITFFSPDEPTCELFTGHIGCGKSTELLRLKAELDQAGFHVVYFESSQDLEMGDVDIGDILLAIATDDLMNFIQQTADDVFSKVLDAGAGRYLDSTALNLQVGSPRR